MEFDLICQQLGYVHACVTNGSSFFGSMYQQAFSACVQLLQTMRIFSTHNTLFDKLALNPPLPLNTQLDRCAPPVFTMVMSRLAVASANSRSHESLLVAQ